jgi:hypothetical protein
MGEAFTPMRLRVETDRLLLTPQEEGDAPWLAELFTTRGTGTFTEQDALAKVDGATLEHGVAPGPREARLPPGARDDR